MPSHAVAPYEDKKTDLAVKDFLGVNTQAGRTAIAENEFAWLENLMPVGYANLKAVPHQGVAVATMPASSVSYWKYINLSNTDYLAIFSADGAGRLLNLNSFAFTTIGAAATFTFPVACAQWENDTLLIVDAGNYYAWNGTTLLKNGSVIGVTVTAPGSGYSAVATIAFTGGGGLGAAASAAMMLVATPGLAAPGTGYQVGDILTLAGGTSSVAAQLRVDTIGGAGDITGGSIYTAGSYTVLPASPNTPTGGHGTGCQLTLNTWGVESATVTNGGTVPYTSAPTVTFSAATSAATGTADLIVGPDGGQTIATFAGRVWIGNNRTVSYSAPASFIDFTTGSAGGSFIVTDETLHSNITAMLTANNFLYLFGTSSINVISDVRVTGTPAVTVFSNTNIEAIIGTDLPYSIFPYYRTIGFATRFGFYALLGATPQKISDALDGMYGLINFSNAVSADVARIHNILCMAFLFRYNDPAVNGGRALLAVYFNKKWFFSSQSDSLKLGICGFQGGVPSFFATDGVSIYKLFSDASRPVRTKIITPLWPMKEPTRTKQVLKGGVELTSGDVVTTIDMQVDTDTSSYPLQLTGDNLGQWANSAGVLDGWVNNAGTVGYWITTGFQIFQGDIEAYGRYVGYTITSSSPAYSIEGLLMQIERKANWATKAT